MTTSPTTDAELLARVRAGDRSAEAELLNRHEGLVRAAVRDSAYPASIDAEDLLQVGRLALWRAMTCPRFDASKARFTTYATTCIQRAVWKEIARQSRGGPSGVQASEETAHAGDLDPPDTRPNHEPLDTSDLSPLTRALVEQTVTSGEHVASTARRFGLTQPEVRRRLAEALSL